jgi:hypothetical protein
MVHPQRIAHMIEQLARPRRLGKLLFLTLEKRLFFSGEPPKNADCSSAFAADIRGNPKK